MAEPEWTKYAVGQPSTREGWTEVPCRPLTQISHTTHVHHALEMVRDRVIVPRLVYDKSKLNTERYPVVWLSPNQWGNGSRYGNVEFWFDFDKLATGKTAYWVEAADYSPAAPRILLTDRASVPAGLSVYDPTLGNGPWWKDPSTGQHWWNGKYTLEIMIDGPLPLAECVEVDFTKHKADGCCLFRGAAQNCTDLGSMADAGRHRFITALVLNNSKATLHHVLAHEKEASKVLLQYGRDLYFWAKRDYKKICVGTKDEHDALAPILGRAYLDAWFLQKDEEMELIASQFSSVDSLIVAASRVVDKYFGLSGHGILKSLEED